MKLFSGKMLETLLIEQRRYSEGLLPEIIKRLINCSGAEVDRLRIPDGDDVWAPGYDGIVSAKVESRYITAGKSVWEFGCSSDSLAKSLGCPFVCQHLNLIVDLLQRFIYSERLVENFTFLRDQQRVVCNRL